VEARVKAVRTARRVLPVIAALVLAAGCSVSTPRHGRTAAGATNLQTGAGAASSGDFTESAAGADAGADAGAAAGVASGGGSAANQSGRSGSATAAPRGSQAQAPAGPSGSTVGVSSNRITVSIVAGFSGASGPVIDRLYQQGVETWIKDVNANGGIFGRQVVAKKVDHADTVGGGVAACRTILSNGSFTALTIQGLGDGNFAVADCLDQAGFTNIAFTGAPSASWKYVFGWVPSSVDQGKSLASFVANTMKDRGKKLGVIHLTQPVYVTAKDAYLKEAKAMGLNVVDVEAVEPNQASFTSQLLRLREKGAENVAAIVSLEITGILRDAQALGYRPHWSGLSWMFDFITAAARNTADGAMGLRYTASVNSPAYAAFQKKMAQYGGGGATDGESMVFYGGALLLQRVLESAGRSPTSTSLLAGIQTIKNYDNGIVAPISYSQSDHAGTRASFPVICCNGDYTWKGIGAAAASF
jgi:ABC-type branched-subunit amino acid transport system substrate-binding protein